MIVGRTRHPLITHLVRTFAAEVNSRGRGFFAGGIHGLNSGSRGAHLSLRIHGESHTAVIITGNVMGDRPTTESGQCCQGRNTAQMLPSGSIEENSHRSIHVDRG